MKIAILILCLALVGCGQPTGRYQLLNNNDGTVWKIDTVTGAVWFCEDTGTAQAIGAQCIQAVQR